MCTMHAPDSQVMANTAGLLRAKSAVREVGWLERTMEGADAAPCLLERLSEAMLQSFYDRFGGLSKLTKGWTGVYMADRGGRMRTRTAMLEISWLPRSLEGADASFWPANVCLSIFPGLCASFCFWVRGLTLFPVKMSQVLENWKPRTKGFAFFVTQGPRISRSVRVRTLRTGRSWHY